ncbi:hypothetical protein JIG36_02310 [Actinoplanes sp. LDG1-06]|uniref:Uncharacterized protein n=1 Tax=Paractinoplanes ovalisporus TaxID=2810368 RepID=A0ABS2A3W3_9ACTN|nr:DUF6193 family natural product biosynthesis protein [Actinoplanes ovalisporus]MBM2614390.1 hypothetical protein [Actinoplanes ovalisporus]
MNLIVARSPSSEFCGGTHGTGDVHGRQSAASGMMASMTSMVEAVVAAGWLAVRDDGRVRLDLLEAAHSEPRLRRLFPWTGMGELHFSRCTEWPWGWDIPYIEPVKGGAYRVAGPSRSEIVGPAATAREAVAMVVERLPPGADAVFLGRWDELVAHEARDSRVDEQ